MSFRDTPLFSATQKLGCLAYGICGSLIVGFCLVGAALGDCAPEADGTGCENDGLFRMLMFPGSLIVVIVGGVLLARYMTRKSR